MFKLFIIGISDQFLSDEQQLIISACSLVVGTKRFEHFALVQETPFQTITPLSEAIENIKKTLATGNVCVLASGDPLFFGIGKLLLKKFSKDCIEILPALSAIQRACALFKLPWDDATIISLHGRKTSHSPGLLLINRKTVLFTDRDNSPNNIAWEIAQYLNLIGDRKLLDSIVVHVAEDLGMETQKVTSGSITHIAKKSFSPLNIVCIELPENELSLPYAFGLKEESIGHSRGLITKNEVRAATLHQLQLPAKGIFWDIGAGSGSISIEAARINPQLTVYAVEHKIEEIENIKNNIVKFGCYNIVPIHGPAPDVLAELPQPDRVFVGGSGGSLAGIVSHFAGRCTEGNERIVINGVIEKTVTEAPVILMKHGFKVDKSIIAVTRENHGNETALFNPITIMTGTK